MHVSNYIVSLSRCLIVNRPVVSASGIGNTILSASKDGKSQRWHWHQNTKLSAYLKSYLHSISVKSSTEHALDEEAWVGRQGGKRKVHIFVIVARLGTTTVVRHNF